MDFAFTPEQIQLRNMVRDFATAEIGPHVSEWDEDQIFPLEAVKQAGQLGYWAPFSRKNSAAPGLATSITPSSSKNCRAWIRLWR